MPAGPPPTIATQRESHVLQSGHDLACHRTRLWLWGHKVALCLVLGSHVPELRALELLVVVSRTGSLSAAAAELGITQQAASSRVRTMESLVGAPLLDRSRRGSRADPDRRAGGAVGRRECWRPPSSSTPASRPCGPDRRGHLAIAASLTIAEHLLPGWLVALRAEQAQLGRTPTDVTMTATNSERVVALVAAGEVDLGFVEGPDAPRTCTTGWSARDTLVVVVGPGHPWAQRSGRRVAAATLAATPLVVREPGSGTRTVLAARARRTADRGRPPSSCRVRRPSGPPSPPVPAPRRSARTPSATTWPPATGPHQRGRPRPHPAPARRVAGRAAPARGAGAVGSFQWRQQGLRSTALITTPSAEACP